MIEIRAFDGDLQEISELIMSSWVPDYKEEYKQPVIDYSSIDFLEWNLKKPNVDPENLFGAYSNGKLVGFLGSFPHQLHYNDQILKSGTGSFFTTHNDYKRKGVGKALVRAFWKRCRERGFDVGICITDEGHPAGGIVDTVADDLDMGLFKALRFTFLSKPLDENKVAELTYLPFIMKIGLKLCTKKSVAMSQNAYGFEPEKDVSVICEMLNNAPYANDTLRVYWENDILISQLRGRLSDTMFLNHGNRKGIINYYTIDLLGFRSIPKRHKMTVINNVWFENLSFLEKHRFVSDFCADQKKNGSCLISIPTIPAFDLVPFYSNLFIPSGRYHIINVIDFSNKLGKIVKVGFLFFL